MLLERNLFGNGSERESSVVVFSSFLSHSHTHTHTDTLFSQKKKWKEVLKVVNALLLLMICNALLHQQWEREREREVGI